MVVVDVIAFMYILLLVKIILIAMTAIWIVRIGEVASYRRLARQACV